MGSTEQDPIQVMSADSHCSVLERRSKSPNIMPDVPEFLGTWNNSSAHRKAATLLRSSAGNINTVGLPGIHEADDLDPAHPQWREAIEDGVWPLVEAVTTGSEWRTPTYDSCQGHAYEASPELEPAWRRVGLLPRSHQEFRTVAVALCATIRAVAPQLPDGVRITLTSCDLTCGTTGAVYAVLDLSLEPASTTSANDYWSQVDAATDLLAGALRANPPSQQTSCGCTA